MNDKDIKYENEQYIYTPPCDTSVISAIQTACQFAKRTKNNIYAQMNDVKLLIDEKTDCQQAYSHYCRMITAKNATPCKIAHKPSVSDISEQVHSIRTKA